MFSRIRVVLMCCALCCATLAAATKWTPSDYRMEPRADISNEMYSGYMPLSLKEDNDEGAFFFWLVKQSKAVNDTTPPKDTTNAKPKRLVIWLNGGPGCTSLLGLIMENGPFTVKDKEGGGGGFSFLRNRYSWSEEADVIYVEQPIRTGFSLASQEARTIKKEKQVSQDFALFLHSLMEIFPEYHNRPLFIAGESYAGFYIPWIAQHILRLKHSKNEEDRAAMATVDLQGVAIGNGAIDYAIQEPSYAEYAYYHGLIPLQTKERLEEEWARCMDSFQEGGSTKYFLTVGDFDKCDLMGKTLAASGYPNEYNVETFHSYGSLLFGNSTFMRFFNDPGIQTWLHVRGGGKKPLPGLNFPVASDEGQVITARGQEGQEEEQVFVPAGWQACNDQINVDMQGDHPTSSVPAIRFVANHIRVLLYNGEFDLNCNFLGTQHTLEKSLWGKNSDEDWKEAQRALWVVDDEVAGQHYQLGNLSFLVVKGAGHLMPMDKPKEALSMISRFLSGHSFADRVLPAAVEYEGVALPGVAEESSFETHGEQGGHIGLFLLLVAAVAASLVIIFRHRQQQQLKQQQQQHHHQHAESWTTNVGYQQVYSYEKN